MDFIKTKGPGFCHKLKLSIPYTSLQPNLPLEFGANNFVKSNNQSFKYQWFVPSGCKDKWNLKI